MRILSIGECMAELSPVEGSNNFCLGYAGDTFNTAWYLARLCPELTVSFYTAIGSDAISLQMRDAITSGGIDDNYVQAFEGATVGLYLISLDNGERSFSYWRGQSAARRMMLDQGALITAISASEIVYFSGITLAILDKDQREFLLNSLRDARSQGKKVVFDPNLRPRLWTDTGEMTKAIMEGGAVSDTILPSFEDEAEWYRDENPQATVDRYLGAGATSVIVKNGDNDVLYYDGTNIGSVAVNALSSVVDSTAAGDSFNAEILAGLVDDTPFEISIERACKLASLVVQGRGALVPISLDHISR